MRHWHWPELLHVSSQNEVPRSGPLQIFTERSRKTSEGYQKEGRYTHAFGFQAPLRGPILHPEASGRPKGEGL